MFQEGEMLSKELGDEFRVARFYSAMGMYYTYRGNPQLGIEYVKRTFEKARTNHDFEFMGSLASSLSFDYSTSGEFYKIADMVPDVIDLIEKAKRKSDFFSWTLNPYSILCALCGFSMGLLGNFEEGRITLDKGLRTDSEINHLVTLGFVEIYYSLFFAFRGEWEIAKAHFQKSIKHSEEAKYGALSGLSWSYLGYVCSMLADSKVGKRHAEKGLEIFRDSGMESVLSLFYYLLGSICQDLGDLKNAQSHTDGKKRGIVEVLINDT